MNLVSFSVYGKMQESGLIEIIFFFFNVHLDSLNLLAIQETQVQSLGQEYPLEKGMALTHSNFDSWLNVRKSHFALKFQLL